MPSIAQQDYLRPSGKALADCHLLAALAHNIQQGTIFDTIMGFIDVDESLEIVKIIGFIPEGNNIFFYDNGYSGVNYLHILYSQTQYEGLAAIQDATQEYSMLPEFEDDGDGRLYENAKGIYVCVEGKFLAVTVSDNNTIAALAISGPAEDADFVNITWEDAQKLIGLPISI